MNGSLAMGSRCIAQRPSSVSPQWITRRCQGRRRRGGFGPGHLKKRIGCYRRAVEVALSSVAPVFPQTGGGFVILDALGDDRGTQTVGESHHRIHDGSRTLVAEQHRREKVVGQFQLIEGQVAQMGQCRVAGAAVVESNTDTAAPQLLKTVFVRSRSAKTMSSVISRVNVAALRPRSASVFAIAPGSSRLASVGANRFTATGMSIDASCHTRHRREPLQNEVVDGFHQAVTADQGQERIGAQQTARVGWAQRTNASTPTICRVFKSICGW